LTKSVPTGERPPEKEERDATHERKRKPSKEQKP